MKKITALAIAIIAVGIVLITAVTTYFDLSLVFNVLGGFALGLGAFPLAERIIEG